MKNSGKEVFSQVFMEFILLNFCSVFFICQVLVLADAKKHYKNPEISCNSATLCYITK